jgi:protein TonB
VLEAVTDFRRRRQGARGITGSAGVALAISFVAHAVAAVTIGAVVVGAHRSANQHQEPIQVDLDAVPADPAPPATPDPSLMPPAGHASSLSAPHRRARVTRASIEAPLAPSPVSDAAEDPVPKFVMSAGTVATHAASGAPLTAATASGGAGSDATGTTDVTSEGDVDAPARLLRTSPLVYPPSARQAQIEIDFPVEIVVDTDGKVAAARPLRRAGYGLDEAAIRAIRAYRFSPAMRGGRPVRVRMRWTVQFRLQ